MTHRNPLFLIPLLAIAYSSTAAPDARDLSQTCHSYAQVPWLDYEEFYRSDCWSAVFWEYDNMEDLFINAPECIPYVCALRQARRNWERSVMRRFSTTAHGNGETSVLTRRD